MEIDIALDDYDDIFSDFDIREYEKRAISSDFVYEILSRIKDKKIDNVSILLTLPRKRRDKRLEKIIKKRLRRFFDSLYHKYKEKEERTKRRGLIFIIAGIGVLFLAIWLEKIFPEWIYEFLFIPSWFFTWNGLDNLFNDLPNIEKRKATYSTLREAKIKFEDEEKFSNK